MLFWLKFDEFEFSSKRSQEAKIKENKKTRESSRRMALKESERHNIFEFYSLDNKMSDKRNRRVKKNVRNWECEIRRRGRGKEREGVDRKKFHWTLIWQVSFSSPDFHCLLFCFIPESKQFRQAVNIDVIFVSLQPCKKNSHSGKISTIKLTDKERKWRRERE